MESLLNLAWLLVAIVCSIGLLSRMRKQPGRADLWILVTVVVCVMVLLFPVISMTDDLHAELFTAEESGKRRVAGIQVQQLVPFIHAHAAWLLVALVMSPLAKWATSAEIMVPRPLTGMRTAWVSRPPPSLSFA
ncbi:MAG TPA: hypothetical protein VMU28_09780 [Terriglobales bacterium]|nr:hypothetical protein [Terriglobales bacterium]